MSRQGLRILLVDVTEFSGIPGWRASCGDVPGTASGAPGMADNKRTPVHWPRLNHCADQTMDLQ